MIVKDGKVYGIYPIGENISNMMYDSIPVYATSTPQNIIIEAKNLFQKIHNVFEGDFEVLVRLEGSILGEAYVNAALNYNGNGTMEMIPAAGYFYNELAKLIHRYIYNGWEVDQEWIDAAEYLARR